MTIVKRHLAELDDAVESLAAALRERKTRVVFAESCTAGLASAALASQPGISEFFCGSSVTYRNTTKTDWLGVAEEEIKKHTAVSLPVAEAMASGVLHRTIEAEFSASITGDLGPSAAAATDGVVFLAVARRSDDRIHIVARQRVELNQRARVARQTEAAAKLLTVLREALVADA